jgi:hypothetical protein
MDASPDAEWWLGGRFLTVLFGLILPLALIGVVAAFFALNPLAIVGLVTVMMGAGFYLLSYTETY